MSDYQVTYHNTNDDNSRKIPIGIRSNKKVKVATISDAERSGVSQPTTSRTIGDYGYVDLSASTTVDRSSSQQPPTSTGNFGLGQKYPTKSNVTRFQIVNFILIGVGILTSIVLLTLILFQLSSYVANKHDDAILNAVLNSTAMIAQEVGILRSENEKMKQRILLLEEKNENHSTKIDLILHDTKTIHAVLNNTAMIAQEIGILRSEILPKHECPPDSFIGYDRNCYFALMNTTYNYTDAEKACLQLNSFPAYIESDLMYNELLGYFRQRLAAVGLSGFGFWLGEIYDLDSGKVYLMDGRENTWEQKWVPGRPNSFSGHTQMVIRVYEDVDYPFHGLVNELQSTCINSMCNHLFVLCQRPW